MMVTGKELNGLATLLRLAREERAALSEDLDDLLAARKAAEQSLAQSENLAGEGGARRRRILAMLATYEDAEIAAREKLVAALERTRRFEALIAQSGMKRVASDFEVRRA